MISEYKITKFCANMSCFNRWKREVQSFIICGTHTLLLKVEIGKKKWLSTINRDRKIFILYSIIRQYGVIQIILIDYTRIVQKRKKMSVAQNMSAVELFVNKESFFTYLKEICLFQNWNMLKQTNFDTFWWLK